jgi:Ca2+-binding RTX toxin-like protein
VITAGSHAYPELDPVGLACTGGPATVATIDTIRVAGGRDDARLVVDLTGGPFAPGATSEPDGGSEIEFVLERIFAVTVHGSDGPDGLAVGVLGSASAANLNSGEAVADLDILAPAYRSDPMRSRLSSTDFEVYGGAGDDLIDLSGGPGFDGPATFDSGAHGRQGEDEIIGGDRGGALVGGPGDDRIVGGRKPDFLGGGKGPGRDTLISGGGNDLIFGADGRDAIFGGPGVDLIASGRGRDRVRCGPQRDALERTTGLEDQRKGCELVISFEGMFN